MMRGEEMDCTEKARLMAEYENSTAKFLEAVQELQRKMGTSPKEVYERLDRAANEARLKSEHARLSLEEHIAAHHC
jgi:DNA-binding Lrp family transcriptional regulator